MHSNAILISHGFQSHYELGFANGLAQNCVQVTLLGSDNTLVEKLHDKIEFVNIRGSQSTNRSNLTKLLNLLKYHINLWMFLVNSRRPTVFFFGLTTPELLVGVFEGLFLRAISKTYILTVHNLLPHDRHTFHMKCLYWLIYRLPHLLLVHTRETEIALINVFGIDANKIMIVAHGSNDAVEPSPLTSPQSKKLMGFGEHDRVLLFFGGVAPYKGLDLLLDVLERRPNVKLLIAGRCPNSEYGRIIRVRLNALVGVNRAIWNDGYVDESAIGEIFAAADAVVLPYRNIDQSGVLLLALTLGTPLITTNVGSFSTYISSSTGVLVEEPTSAALDRGISDFYATSPTFERQAIMDVGRALAWKNTVKPLLPLLT